MVDICELKRHSADHLQHAEPIPSQESALAAIILVQRSSNACVVKNHEKPLALESAQSRQSPGTVATKPVELTPSDQVSVQSLQSVHSEPQYPKGKLAGAGGGEG